MFRLLSVFLFTGSCLLPPAFSQSAGKVDFARDVQPIFRQNCIGCHGPAKQNNGFRVDRRSSVFKPGTRRVMPGSVENSFLFHRLTGNEFGMQMPPTGPLHPEQIQIIKSWVEQGAPWPDALANEIDLPPVNPKAVAMVDALRAADWKTFDSMVAADPKLLNARGPEGSTPFMYAVLYTDVPTLRRLLKQGADPNRRNDAGATALMWAALDLEKTRLLIASGANVNAKSDDARTPLMIAAGRAGAAAVVKLLLSDSANPNPTSNPGAESSPLLEASLAADADVMKLLLDRGAALKDVGGLALANVAAANCGKCVDLLLAGKMDAMQYTIALQQVAELDNPALVRRLLDRGADVNAVDPTGRTALMYAAISDYLPAEQVKILIEKGANPNASSGHKQSGDSGMTALDIAKLHGHTPVVDVLAKTATAGAVAAPVQAAAYRTGNTIRAAVSGSLPLLQRTDASFMPKAGCFSCHNNSVTAWAVGLARKSGFRVNEAISKGQVQANAGALAASRDVLHQGFLVSGLNANPSILGYALIGLDAEGYKPDLSTDAVAMYIQTHQLADGHWVEGPDIRPPLCSEPSQTVLSLRALQLYAPEADKAAYTRSVQLATSWLAAFQPKTIYDRAWRLLGLAWGGAGKDIVEKARQDLLAAQRSDGGWPDLDSMESTAFTTGLTMVSLYYSGLPVADRAYQRGIGYLLGTQLEDGSWHVRTRAAGFQPYFDNGFPHGMDQFISAAGTGFATIALTVASTSAPAPTVADGSARR